MIKITEELKPIPESELPEGWKRPQDSTEYWLYYTNLPYQIGILNQRYGHMGSGFLVVLERIRYEGASPSEGIRSKYTLDINEANQIALQFMRDVTAGKYGSTRQQTTETTTPPEPRIRAVALYGRTPGEKVIKIRYPRELEGEIVRRLEKVLGIKIDVKAIGI